MVSRAIAGTLNGPFVGLFEWCAHEPDDGGSVCEDADRLAAPFDLAIEPSDRHRCLATMPRYVRRAKLSRENRADTVGL